MSQIAEESPRFHHHHLRCEGDKTMSENNTLTARDWIIGILGASRYWLLLIGGGWLGYQLGGWPAAVAGAIVLFVGSAVIMGAFKGRARARKDFAARRAAGESGLAQERVS
jgi:hypothetical protein